ncbi:MAG: HEAT repeat domain-containing protein [Myxococcota bacterium]
MQALFILCALHVGAPGPSADDAARQVADGGEGARAGLQSLMRKGRFGLRALIKLGRSTSGEEGRRVYEAIGAFRGKEAFSALQEGLRASDKGVQMGAIQGMARTGGPQIVDPLIQTAMAPDEEVRKALVEALTKAGKAADGPAQGLLSSTSPYARETAIRFLARFHSGKKRRQVIVQGLRDTDVGVRAAAVELADLWRDMSLAETLVELSRDKNPEVAARSVEAVAKFPSLRKELPKLLADPRVTRQAWMTAFHRMRDYDDMAIPYLIAAISQAGPKRQAIMLDLLSDDASDGELEAFVNLLDSPKEDVSAVVSGLLSQMGARADTAAARMILDKRESLAEAIRAYLSTRPRNGITDEILDTAMKDPDPERRVEHIGIIGELDPSEVREDLAELLDDTQTEVRVAAAKALGGLKDVGAEAELVRLLDDVKKEVREEALRGLKAYDSRLSVLARMSALEDPDPDVRKAAIASFEGTDADNVLESLERIVRTGSQPERLDALTAIAEVRTERAAVLLVDLVTESDDQIRMAANAYFATLPKLDPIYENAGVGMDRVADSDSL